MFLLAPQNGVLAAPEATGEHHYNPNTFPSVSWTFPATNRLLFESSVSMQAFHNTTKREPGVAPNVIQVTELNNNYRWGSRAVSINTAGGNYTTLKREFYFQRGDRLLHHRVAQPEGEESSAASSTWAVSRTATPTSIRSTAPVDTRFARWCRRRSRSGRSRTGSGKPRATSRSSRRISGPSGS